MALTIGLETRTEIFTRFSLSRTIGGAGRIPGIFQVIREFANLRPGTSTTLYSPPLSTLDMTFDRKGSVGCAHSRAARTWKQVGIFISSGAVQ